MACLFGVGGVTDEMWRIFSIENISLFFCCSDSDTIFEDLE